MSSKRSAVRARCYAELKAVAVDGLEAYYVEHPERLHDKRSLEAIKASMQGLRRVYAVLDKYEIKERPP